MRISIVLGFIALGFCSTAAAGQQDHSPLTKSYEDVRFKVWYMHWRQGNAAMAPYRHEGPVVMVFLGDGTLQQQSGPRQKRHDGEVAYFEPGSVATSGELVTERPLRADVIELKAAGPSRPLPATNYPPMFPRADSTRLIDNARVIVWDSQFRPGQRGPLHLHDKNSVRVWVTSAVVSRAHPNEQPRQDTKVAGAWELTHAGYVDSEEVASPAHAVTLELK
jgi:hypothetical protein